MKEKKTWPLALFLFSADSFFFSLPSVSIHRTAQKRMKFLLGKVSPTLASDPTQTKSD